MKRNILMFTGVLLIAAALIAIPVSAGNGQGTNSGGCHLQAEYQDCAAYSYGSGQGMAYNYQNSESYCQQNLQSGIYCQNSGTGLQYCRGNAYSNSGICPCI